MTAPALLVASTEDPVSADNFNTYEQTCDTFDDLRAFVGTTGMQVCARGKDAVDDGYGGEFYWSASSTGTDDDLNIITPTGQTTGRWLRLNTPYSAAVNSSVQAALAAATVAAFFTSLGVLVGPTTGTSVDFASTTTGRATAGTTITVTGAAVGDYVWISSTTAQTAGCRVYAEVTATNTVTPYFQNLSGSTVDPAAMTLYVIVFPKSMFGQS